MGLRCYCCELATVTVAGQRTAGFLVIAGGSSAWLTQLHRYQKSGHRWVDRTSHFRQGSRRARCGYQVPRQGVAVELLCGAAVDLSLRSYGAVGPIQSSRNPAEIRSLGISYGVVVGQGQGSEGAATIVIA